MARLARVVAPGCPHHVVQLGNRRLLTFFCEDDYPGGRDGEEALEIFNRNPDIKLVVTDFEMPRMDGSESTRSLWEKHCKNELATIGMSASGDPLLTAIRST